jgi:hypothetical protein
MQQLISTNLLYSYYRNGKILYQTLADERNRPLLASNIIQARIRLNQHAAVIAYMHPSLSLATHPKDANLRQRTKLLHRCAMAAEAAGSLWLASSILRFASALCHNSGDIMHEISSLQDTVYARLRSTTHSVLPVSISRLPRRTSHGDESAECSICIAQFSGRVIRLPCEHEFHEHRIATWLDFADTCPLCRKTLGKDQNIPTSH